MTTSFDPIALRVPLVVLACLQAFFAAGIMYGWASLYIIFLDTGVYQDRCDSPHICDAQKSALQWIYTVGSTSNLLSQLPWGCILDWKGPRTCCSLSTGITACGMACLALASPERDLYMLGFVLLAVSGPGVQISLFHLSELFPSNETTVMSLISGSFQLSFLVFLLFQVCVLHFALASFSTICALYVVPLIALTIISAFLWPDSATEWAVGLLSQQTQEHQLNSNEVGELDPLVGATNSAQPPAIKPISPILHTYSSPMASRAGVGRMEWDALPPSYGSIPPRIDIYSGGGHNRSAPLPPARPLDALICWPCRPDDTCRSVCCCTLWTSLWKGCGGGLCRRFSQPRYVSVMLWMVVGLFWANFYIGTAVEQLYYKSGQHHERTRKYAALFNVLLPSGIIAIPLFGWMSDGFGYLASAVATSVMAMGFAFADLWLPLQWQVLTFVFYSLYRTFLFSLMFAYVAKHYGHRYFGALTGILLGLAGLVGFSQTLLQNYDWLDVDEVNQIQAVMLVVSCAVFVGFEYMAERAVVLFGPAPSLNSIA